MRRPSKPDVFKSPFLQKLAFVAERVRPNEFPFTIPIFRGGKLEIAFERPVTIIVGENGTGKSTLLEGIAAQCGFSLSGGNRNHASLGVGNTTPLSQALRLSWLPRVTTGFFMRAETFFNFARYVDDLGVVDAYGGRSLLAQSHGESFMALFENKFGRGRGLYILDEPEAALSMARQLEFLRVIRDLEAEGQSQFIIATHAPILMAYPGAQLLMLDGRVMRPVALSETPHYRIMREFVSNPTMLLQRFFDESEDDGEP